MSTSVELYRPPNFYAGQRLNRDEFYALVESMEQRGERTCGIERLEGVVHMPAAIRVDQHGEPQLWISTWLGAYTAATPGVQWAGNATALIDEDNDPEPDAILRIRSEYGGQSSTDHRGYIDGPPELVVEIAGSTSKTDLQLKLEIYSRAGVREYLVWETIADEFYWFVLKDGDYYRVFPGEHGQLRSQMFPGLWLDALALLKGDLAKVLSVVQAGIGTPEHTEFVQRLESQKRLLETK